MISVCAIAAVRRTNMPDQSDEQRQYEIDRITFQYAEDYRNGRNPRIEDYVRRYPQYERDLLAFAVYFHAVGIDTEALEGPPATELSPAAQKAMARIEQQ